MFLVDTPVVAVKEGCSVTCREGYFACCNNNSCSCLLDGAGDSLCTVGGGEGSVSCSRDARTELE